MGITIVSSVQASPSGNTSRAQPPSDSDSPGFAAQLTRQLASSSLPQQTGSQPLAGTTKPSTAELNEENAPVAPQQDAAAILAAAGFLPAFMVPARPSPTTAGPSQAAQDQITGTTIQQTPNSGKGQPFLVTNNAAQATQFPSAAPEGQAAENIPFDFRAVGKNGQLPQNPGNNPGAQSFERYAQVAGSTGPSAPNSGRDENSPIIGAGAQIVESTGLSASNPGKTPNFAAIGTSAQATESTGQSGPNPDKSPNAPAIGTGIQVTGSAGQPRPDSGKGSNFPTIGTGAQVVGSADQPGPDSGKGPNFPAVGTSAQIMGNTGPSTSSPSKDPSSAATIPSQATGIADQLIPDSSKSQRTPVVSKAEAPFDHQPLNPGKEQAFQTTDTGIRFSLSSGLATDKTANIAADTQPAGSLQNFSAPAATPLAMTHQTQARSDHAETSTAISPPLHDSHWPQDFGNKVVWLAKTDQQVAQININPPQLGPMHITLSVNGDQASAVFTSPHAEVRQVITDAMPQLREMLANAGINLGQANVGSQLSQQQNGAPSRFSNPPPSESDKAILRAGGAQDSMTTLSTARRGRGMVDLFA